MSTTASFDELNESATYAAPPSIATSQSSKRLHSTHGSGMESSVLRFKNMNFVVGNKDKAKNILSDVSGAVKWGRKCVERLIFFIHAQLMYCSQLGSWTFIT
jgi:hypothetical protein